MKSGLNQIKRIKFWHVLLDGHKIPTDEWWVADCRSFDIPTTIKKCIESLNDKCVAITLSPRGGKNMVKWAEHAARKKGIRILWWTY